MDKELTEKLWNNLSDYQKMRYTDRENLQTGIYLVLLIISTGILISEKSWGFLIFGSVAILTLTLYSDYINEKMLLATLNTNKKDK